MKRLWIPDDIYNQLKRFRQGDEPLVAVLRRELGLTKRKYTASGKKSEAVRKGIERARRRGTLVGRPRYPEYVRKDVRQLKRYGHSIGYICGFWAMSRSTVRRILKER